MQTKQYDHTLLLKLLTEEFGNKKLKNSSYSLRSYANYLGISHASLSQMMSGKRPLTNKSIHKFVDRLMLTPEQLKKIELTTNGLSQLVDYKIPKQNFLSQETYMLAAEWHYYAILSLAETDDFEGTKEWISKRLGISKKKTSESLELLIKYGYLKKDKSGEVSLQSSNLRTTHDTPNVAIKKRHHDNLSDAQVALQTIDVELREFSCTTMAIDVDKLPEAKKMLREFMRKFCAYLEQDKKTEVYELAIQLFPRTKLKETENEN
jgi:uncharacterized protein (TIGR02147 family)